uniref:Uncharacterized protein n=1 Tax=Denticeps clupeoides TaxID=299321 RepID=A0AAY4EES6_9TELE
MKVEKNFFKNSEISEMIFSRYVTFTWISGHREMVSERVSSSPGAVACACNPSHWEAEAGGSLELRSSELQRTMPIGCRLTRGEPAQVGNGAGQSPRADQ